MPHHKSATKRIRTAEKARVRNRAVRSRVKKVLKTVAEAETVEQLDDALRQASSSLDRAVQKGVIPARRAARKKSRLARDRNRKVAAATGASSG